MKTDPLRSQKHVYSNVNMGFTLIEVMICLAVLTIIASLMPLIFANLYSVNKQVEESAHEEWDMFSIQFRNEVKLHDIERIEPKRLTLKSKEGDTIVFSLYGSLLRRQVNGKGHEVYLTALKDLNFALTHQMIVLEVNFLNGKKREGRFGAYH
ncbi:competence type IV pilus minor pilin ComGF [Jeotgalibacillus campisalis]|uniref:Competence protein ComGF n=1 Tax=Jeotgalibacillus campisalis TaxID=220754 RepID=A0A0C2VNE2_9BACL|nr:competence type IV pilus minor pilin ComGF [Jeotgalibacillus campisalis]KIL45976.1 hypothetical protein KR50_26510 [Jeotgalibacillus campisalis]